jgi:hypothetical protein
LGLPHNRAAGGMTFPPTYDELRDINVNTSIFSARGIRMAVADGR